MKVNEKPSQLSLSQLLFASQSVDNELSNTKVIEQLASLPSQDENCYGYSLNPDEAAFPNDWKDEIVRIKEDSRKWRQEVYSTFAQFKAQKQAKKPASKLCSKQARTASLLELLTKVNKDYESLVKNIAHSELRIQEKEKTNSELKHTLEKLQGKLNKLQKNPPEVPGCSTACSVF